MRYDINTLFIYRYRHIDIIDLLRYQCQISQKTYQTCANSHQNEPKGFKMEPKGGQGDPKWSQVDTNFGSKIYVNIEGPFFKKPYKHD